MEGFRGLLADLDALFGAEIARQEDEAADDLAISLQSDSRLVEVLARGSFQLVMDERTIPVESLGRDFVESATFIVPLGRYHFIACAGEQARSTDLSFVDRLRSLARSGATVEIRLEDQTLHGILSGVSPEHLLIQTRTGSAVVPLGSISWARLSPEDSTDVS